MNETTTPKPIDKRWILKPTDPNVVNQLQTELGIAKSLCQILVNRGIDTFDKAKAFFRPHMLHTHDPFLMKDMDKAVERIVKAIENRESIMVFGDYDVDGTSAVAVMYSFLRSIHKGELSFYVPHRYKEGYGVSIDGIDLAHAQGTTLIIALDCGIKSVEKISYAKELGIDFVVCDHHLPDEVLPPAVAILNPKQSDCPYPFKELCGCAIGYKLVTALCQELGLPEEKADEYLDFVATSIAADIVSMTDENRVLAHFGMEKVNNNPNKSIALLKQVAGVQKPMHISDLVFAIGPIVNAAGRMDDAKKAVQLFVEQDEAHMLRLVQELKEHNLDRKSVDKSTTAEALQLLADESEKDKRSTVVYQQHWHKGVVGIVASRLIDYYYRPTIVLAGSNGLISGSARSIKGINIHDAIESCSDLLENFGGHFFAAGLTMKPENLEPFKKRFEAYMHEHFDASVFVPEILIDAEIDFSNIRQNYFDILKQFEPFGPDNLRPVFISKNVLDFQNQSRVVKEAHLRVVLCQLESFVIDGIGFNMADSLALIKAGPVDIVYTIDENHFNNKTTLQLKIIDVRQSE